MGLVDTFTPPHRMASATRALQKDLAEHIWMINAPADPLTISLYEFALPDSADKPESKELLECRFVLLRTEPKSRLDRDFGGAKNPHVATESTKQLFLGKHFSIHTRPGKSSGVRRPGVL